MSKQPPMKLTAHPNVTSLADARREREWQRAAELSGEAVQFVMGLPPGFVPMFPGFQAAPAEPEITPPPAVPERRQQLGWLKTILGWAKRSRAS